jgi:tripartite-type tricarboxylate transporter receptor subunit TctC
MNTALRAVLSEPNIVDKLAAQGMDTAPTTPEEFGTLIRDELARWAKVAGQNKAATR